jgi:transcriptional regulator with XRE-family HTH domain
VTERALRFDGDFMSLIRIRARMSFEELARRSGTTRSHLWNIEHHKSDPSFSLAVDISEALGVGIQYFVINTPGRPRPAPKPRGREP